MAKDAYWFSHDANARNDKNMVKLRRMLSMKGVGIYWCIIEMLREEPGYKLPEESINEICFDLRCDQKDVMIIINDCGLLKIEDGLLFSESLIGRMSRMDEIREARAIAGYKGGKSKAKRKQKSSKKEAKPSYDSIEQNSIKENIKKKFVPPNLQDVKTFFKDKGFGAELAERAFDYYDTANWKDSKGNKVRNWKQKMISVWLKPENKIKNYTDGIGLPAN